MAVKIARRRLVLGLVLYAAAVSAITVYLWPLMPFPEPLPLAGIAGASFLFGFAMRRRALLLPAVLFPVGWALAGIGWFGGVVAMAVAAPAALSFASLGTLTRGGFIRLAARRARRRERGRRRSALRLRRRQVAVP